MRRWKYCFLFPFPHILKRTEFCYASLIFCGTGLVTTQLKNAYNNLWTSHLHFSSSCYDDLLLEPFNKAPSQRLLLPTEEKKLEKKKKKHILSSKWRIFLSFSISKWELALKGKSSQNQEQHFTKTQAIRANCTFYQNKTRERRLCSFKTREL